MTHTKEQQARKTVYKPKDPIKQLIISFLSKYLAEEKPNMWLNMVLTG